jgi:hypothetical protein
MTALSNTLTIESVKKPGKVLQYKTLNCLKNRAHPIFLNEGFNTRSTIIKNIYQSLFLCAKRFCVYVKHAFVHRHMNLKFLKGRYYLKKELF